METHASPPSDSVDADYEIPEEPSAVFERMRSSRTDMVVFNSLLNLVEEYIGGQADLDEVFPFIVKVDEALGELRMQFEDGLRFREHTPELDKITRVVMAMLALLQEQFARLNLALEEGRHYDAAIALQESNAAVNQIFWAFGELKRRAAEEERHSESPYVNELLRVGKAYLAGTLPIEPFQERFEAFFLYHNNFVSGFRQMPPQLHPVVQEQRPRLQAALDQQTEGLEALQTFFEMGNRKVIEPSLILIREATEALIEMQKLFQQAPSAPVSKVCPTCAAENPADARVCQSCTGRFPEIIPESSEPSLALQYQEGAGSRGMSANMQKLLDAAKKISKKEISLEEFARVVDWFEDLLEQVTARFQQMEEPKDPNIPRAQWAVFEEAANSMEEGLAQMRQGADLLRVYLERPDPLTLDRAIKSCLSGGDQLLHVAEIQGSL